MKLKLHKYTLPLEHEFTIARGSRSCQHTLIVEISQGETSGFGEVTVDDYYGHSYQSMSASMDRCRPLIERFPLDSVAVLWEQLHQLLPDDSFALCALDLAAHDLFGKLNAQPTFVNLGLLWQNIPQSSYTIGIDSIDTMVAKLQQHSGWGIYKIKLGTPHDVDIVRELRKQTAAVFRVDANCGWTPEQTVANSHELKALNVEFIEQPLAPDASRDDQRRVFEESALPLVADEDCQVESDVAKCDGLFHGVNVKLCKCGGLTPAVRMLRDARSRGMKTMVGCMVESTVGISAAVQLLPLVDYADLDGAVLISKDPATGARIDQGNVELSHLPGNGVELLPESSFPVNA